jgi:hypothetical protein
VYLLPDSVGHSAIRVCRALLGTLAAVSVLSESAVAQGLREKDLRLDELESVTLPNGLLIAGGLLSATGETLLWSGDAIWSISKKTRVLSRLCQASQLAPMSAWFGDAPGHYWVADGLSHQLLEVSAIGHCTARPVAPVPDSALYALGGDSIIRRIEVSGRTQVAITRIGRNEKRGFVSVSPRSPIRLGPVHLYVAGTDRSDVLITERLYPFRSLSVGDRGQIVVRLDPTRSFPADLRASLLSGWRSLRVVELGDGVLLQVLADTRSDERRTLLYSAKGDVVRTRSHDVAFGILDSDPALRRLLALRNTGKREIVFYSWRWQAADSLK